MSGGEPTEFDLVECLDHGLYRLPVDAVRELGPVTLTLAGLLKVTDKVTFASAEKIASESRLPVATVRKHLAVLNENNWIHNNGRERTEAGRPRRTCTIRITSKTMKAKATYYPLPWWAYVTRGNGWQRFPWGSKVLLGIVLRRLCELKAVAGRNPGTEEEDVFDLIEDDYFGPDRFAFSLNQLETSTGLSRPAILDAKRHLARLGAVKWTWSGDHHTGDIIAPSRDFRVKVTPTSPGLCSVEFLKTPELANR